MVKRLAALAVVGALLLGACGDDDDGGDEAGDGSGTTEETAGDESQGGSGDGGAEETGGGGAGEGYTDQMRSAFVSSCTSQQGASESQCECAFDEISQTVPVAEFLEWSEALAQDPSAPPPAGVADAAASCGG